MRLISFGNINKNIFIFLFAFILIYVGVIFIDLYFILNKDAYLKNIFQNYINLSIFNILFGIIGMIIRKCSSNKKRKNKNYDKNDHNIIIISYPQKEINPKKLIFSIF